MKVVVCFFSENPRWKGAQFSLATLLLLRGHGPFCMEPAWLPLSLGRRYNLRGELVPSPASTKRQISRTVLVERGHLDGLICSPLAREQIRRKTE